MAGVLKEFAPSAKSLKRVVVCLYGREAYETFRRVFEEEMH
jgi:O-acetyl-ADP-ribose deacetylase (regulator of RNase III)